MSWEPILFLELLQAVLSCCGEVKKVFQRTESCSVGRLEASHDGRRWAGHRPRQCTCRHPLVDGHSQAAAQVPHVQAPLVSTAPVQSIGRQGMNMAVYKKLLST